MATRGRVVSGHPRRAEVAGIPSREAKMKLNREVKPKGRRACGLDRALGCVQEDAGFSRLPPAASSPERNRTAPLEGDGMKPDFAM